MRASWTNTENAWGAVARGFHWLLAVLILAQLALGKIAEEAPLSPQKIELFVGHKSLGVTILLLAALRLAWRLGNPPPAPPPGIPRWETIAARAGHTLLYLLMFAVPLSGWWISDTSRVPFKAYWILPMPDLLAVDRPMQEVAEAVHGTLTATLLVIVIVHVAAALRHHFILRNETLRRMLPAWRNTP